MNITIRCKMKENFSKNKVWQILGVAVLCAVTVLGAVLGVLFGMNHSSEDLNISKDMSNQDPLFIESTQEQGITILSGVATYASDNSLSKVLTASVDNEDAKKLPYSWSVAFKNASSTWAKGKNISDYVTVEKSSASDLQATVTCKQAFGEQIIVTVSSDYGSASASCTVDYKKRVLHNKITFACENTAYSFVLTDELSGDDYGRESDDFVVASKTEEQMPQYTITIEITFSDGTVTGEYHLTLQSGNSSVYTINSGTTVGFGAQFMSMEKFNLNEMMDINLVYDGKTVCYWTTSFCEPAKSMILDNTSIVF
mgnify:CR=1 FL=1